MVRILSGYFSVSAWARLHNIPLEVLRARVARARRHLGFIEIANPASHQARILYLGRDLAELSKPFVDMTEEKISATATGETSSTCDNANCHKNRPLTTRNFQEN